MNKPKPPHCLDLIRFRQGQRISQREMCERLGLKQSTYSGYERNSIPPPSIRDKIAQHFGVVVYVYDSEKGKRIKFVFPKGKEPAPVTPNNMSKTKKQDTRPAWVKDFVAFRLETGLSQNDFSVKCGWHFDTYRKIETSGHYPNTATLKAIETAFNVRIEIARDENEQRRFYFHKNNHAD